MSDNTTTMKIDANRVIRLRNQRAWSQHHLAEVCGLSLRTIQRVEKQAKASQETVKALASVFEIKSEELIESHSNINEPSIATASSDHCQTDKTNNDKWQSKLILSVSGLLALLAALIWVPMSSASDVEVHADNATSNEDSSAVFSGNVSIAIPTELLTEIKGRTMWTAGGASFFEGNVEIATSSQKYQMQSAVVTQTKTSTHISTDTATLVAMQ